ncbi:MAG: RNA polymerase factor sigma-32, partial [Rhodobacteraceae bacterium]|nr:RNA polymerase factor sigma-32 [Paracoccaceae bacterium]
KAKARIGAIEEGDLRPENVKKLAEDLSVSEHEVVDMNRRLAGSDASLNITVGGEEGSASWQDWLQDEDADQAGDYAERDEFEARQAMLMEAMDVLNERERDILTERKLAEPAVTLEELSAKYDVSRERIRQIEVRAFEKLQTRMREIAAEKGMIPA